MAKGEKMGRYEANGFVIYPGITVGEYRKMIMTSIYGKEEEVNKMPEYVKGSPAVAVT